MAESLLGLTGESGLLAMGIIFVILLACGVGLPLPEELLLLLAGYFAHQGMVTLPVALVVCMLGVLLGDITIYVIGRYMGIAVFDIRWFRRLLKRRRLRKIREYFKKYGVGSVAVARFVSGLRTPVFASAGTLRMPFYKFLLVDGIAALIHIPIAVWLGFYFGDEISTTIGYMQDTRNLITIVTAIILLGVVLRYLIVRRQRATQTAEATPASE